MNSLEDTGNIYALKDETCSSTTFLIFACKASETFPVAISSKSAVCVEVKCSRNSASQRVILSTAIESSYTRTVSSREHLKN